VLDSGRSRARCAVWLTLRRSAMRALARARVRTGSGRPSFGHSQHTPTTQTVIASPPTSIATSVLARRSRRHESIDRFALSLSLAVFGSFFFLKIAPSLLPFCVLHVCGAHSSCLLSVCASAACVCFFPSAWACGGLPPSFSITVVVCVRAVPVFGFVCSLLRVSATPASALLGDRCIYV